MAARPDRDRVVRAARDPVGRLVAIQSGCIDDRPVGVRSGTTARRAASFVRAVLSVPSGSGGSQLRDTRVSLRRVIEALCVDRGRSAWLIDAVDDHPRVGRRAQTRPATSSVKTNSAPADLVVGLDAGDRQGARATRSPPASRSRHRPGAPVISAVISFITTVAGPEPSRDVRAHHLADRGTWQLDVRPSGSGSPTVGRAPSRRTACDRAHPQRSGAGGRWRRHLTARRPMRTPRRRPGRRRRRRRRPTRSPHRLHDAIGDRGSRDATSLPAAPYHHASDHAGAEHERRAAAARRRDRRRVRAGRHRRPAYGRIRTQGCRPGLERLPSMIVSEPPPTNRQTVPTS